MELKEAAGRVLYAYLNKTAIKKSEVPPEATTVLKKMKIKNPDIEEITVRDGNPRTYNITLTEEASKKNRSNLPGKPMSVRVIDKMLNLVVGD